MQDEQQTNTYTPKRFESKFIFSTPTRVSDIHNLRLRANVYNIVTGQGSTIQKLETSVVSPKQKDIVQLGHFLESGDHFYSLYFMPFGEYEHQEMKDWVVTDIPTYQEGNVAEYQNVKEIRSHYEYLNLIWESFHQLVFNKKASESFCGGMVGAHGDKGSSHKHKWGEKDIPYFRGMLLFLLTYKREHECDDKGLYVIENYEKFLPQILEVEKQHLINVQEWKSTTEIETLTLLKDKQNVGK